MATIGYLTTAQFDFGAIQLVSAECRRLGIRRPLIVTDAGIRACGLLERLRAMLAAHPTLLVQYAAIEGGSGRITAAVAALIAIPTTASEGSAVGRGAVFCGLIGRGDGKPA